MVKANEIAQRCKDVLDWHYGFQFKGLILYESMARNQTNSMSDVDLLVLLSKPFDYLRELRQKIRLRVNTMILLLHVLINQFSCCCCHCYCTKNWSFTRN